MLRAKRKLENITSEWKREIHDKLEGHTYKSAMQVPSTTGADGVPIDKNTSRPYCRACENYGHQRRTSKLCRLNPKSQYYEVPEGKCV